MSHNAAYVGGLIRAVPEDTMIFGGLEKNSLIDFPGKVSCVFFVSGCNFDCPYCHNPGLVKGGKPEGFGLNDHEMVHFLESRQDFLDGVVISGGEPTLQEGLVSLCRKIKTFGFAVKLDTNGSRPRVLKMLFERNLVDYIAMDIKTDPLEYDRFITNGVGADCILESIQTIMKSGIAYEFRTTCVPPIVDKNKVERIAELIAGADLYALQRFHTGEVLHPEFFSASGTGFDDDGLEELRKVASRWVKRCIVR